MTTCAYTHSLQQYQGKHTIGKVTAAHVTLGRCGPHRPEGSVMPVRSAKAAWKGSFREGTGTASFGDFEGRYTFASRFEEGEGTDPEEMLGAAFAACFSMALAADLGRAGFEPDEVRSEAQVHIGKRERGFPITHIDLATEARVPGIDDATFQEQAQNAKRNCPVSRALAVKEINLDARLV